MIRKIDHVTINVTDLAGTLRFYGDLLGLVPLPTVDMGDHELHYFAIPGGAMREPRSLAGNAQPTVAVHAIWPLR